MNICEGVTPEYSENIHPLITEYKSDHPPSVFKMTATYITTASNHCATKCSSPAREECADHERISVTTYGFVSVVTMEIYRAEMWRHIVW
jgi:hypothetical protein